MKNLGFHHSESTYWVLKNINLRFVKGSRIGFIGTTGIGKSTLLDIIMDSDDKHISFDRHKNRLRIDMDWANEVAVDQYIVVECYRIIDPDTYTDVYNDYFLKRYATALIKQQWGQNLLKFEGMTMPGGVQFNGRQIFEDAKEELEKLNEEVRLNWEQPVDFYTG